MAGHALPDLVARIKIDSTGVDSAMTSMAGSFDKAALKMAGAAAGIGLLVLGGKQAVEVTEKHQKAENDLAQAYTSSGTNLGTYRGQIDRFIKSSSSYVGSQDEILAGYAELTRAGLTQTQVQRDMNIAVDLAALKHIPLAEAVGLVNKAEHGRYKGLIDLGITMKGYIDSQGNVIGGAKSEAGAIDELEKRTAHGRDTLTETEQAQNRLNHSWEDVANRVGPPILDLITAVANGLDWVVRGLNSIGANKDWNVALSMGLGKVQDAVVGIVKGIGQFIAGLQWIASNASRIMGGVGGVGGALHGVIPGLASGGPALPGRIYTVGEAGPETLIMGSSGGMVIPQGGKSSGSADASETNALLRTLAAIHSRQLQLLESIASSTPRGAMYATQRIGG
jgi:hypothetical protein